MHKCKLTVFASVLLFSSTLLAASSSTAVTTISVEGEEKSRTLQDVTESAFKFENSSVPFGELSEVRFSGTGSLPGRMTIVMRNGDRVGGDVLSGDDSKVKIKNGAMGELTLENKLLDAILFGIKDGPSSDAIEAFLKAPPAKEDQLLTPKGDSNSGFIEKFSDKDLSFNAGGQSHTYAFDKVAALRLAPLEEFKPAGGVNASLLLRDGSQISAKIVGLNGDALKVAALEGKVSSVPLSELQSIIFKGGKLVQLSDLVPKSVEERPYAGNAPLVFHWRKDRSVTGARLTIGAAEYDRGIGVHSYSRLTYDLNGEYAKLLGEVGIDAAAPASAVCTWKVLLDGKESTGGTAKAGADPEKIKIELKGAKQLELICDYGPDEDDAGDHLDWANVRLIRN